MTSNAIFCDSGSKKWLLEILPYSEYNKKIAEFLSNPNQRVFSSGGRGEGASMQKVYVPKLSSSPRVIDWKSIVIREFFFLLTRSELSSGVAQWAAPTTTETPAAKLRSQTASFIKIWTDDFRRVTRHLCCRIVIENSHFFRIDMQLLYTTGMELLHASEICDLSDFSPEKVRERQDGECVPLVFSETNAQALKSSCWS